MASPFIDVISEFFKTIRSLDTTLPFIASVLDSTSEQAKAELHTYLEKNAIKKEKDNKNPSHIIYSLRPEHGLQIRRLSFLLSSAELAVQKVPESFIVTLISQFDAYLGSLLRVLFAKKPQLIDASEKKMSFTEIASFASIDDARQCAIEREIDSVIRESHIEQIAWLERRLGTTLTKDLAVLPVFIEVTERRNLFVHTGGKVTTQYLKVCKENNVILPKSIKLGDLLTVERSYFDSACDSVLELGIKLGHVLWRKVAEEELEEADNNLNLIGYELIHAEEYHLASSILEFATETIKKHFSEEILLFMQINKAQSYKWAGDNDRCSCVLKSIDWTVKAPKYQMVRCVLDDKYQDAANIMKAIGVNDEIGIQEYVEWPIFQNFRQSELFQSTYRDIFGSDYQVIKTIETDNSHNPS